MQLVQNPKNPLFISYQCSKCSTWNCFNIQNYVHIVTIGLSPIIRHYCHHCTKMNSINTYDAMDLILRKHNIVIARDFNYCVAAQEKIVELVNFYKMLGSANEKPNNREDHNPYSDMFED